MRVQEEPVYNPIQPQDIEELLKWYICFSQISK